MSRRGIPASLERREFLMRAAALGAVLAAAAGGVLYLVARPLPTDVTERGKDQGDVDPVADVAAERERASAYKAVRDYMDARNWGSDIRTVYCRDSAHQVFTGGLIFTGRIDLEPLQGDLIPMDYTATARGSIDTGWTIESVELRTVPGYLSEEAAALAGSSSEESPLSGTAGASGRNPEASTQ
ncbi:MAG: hypothetical protein GC168_18200 [Candidatus Hydrogenedens sp.]|nr:hypothetical protein [Candidatus Hydrogenedens sp.]